MNNREIVYRSLEIIEENLRSQMTVQDLSDRLGYSVYYFIRLFRGITGQPPGAYLGRRRITEAWRELCEGSHKVIDLAFEFGFGTPESFSRAFSRQLGISPGRLGRDGDIDRMGLQPPLTPEGLERLRTTPRQEPELIERGPLNLIGLSLLYGPDMPEDLSKPWNTLVSNREAITSRLVPEKYYQVQYWLPNQDYGSIFFFISLEAGTLDDIPMQFTAKTLPRHHYLRFLHKGPSNTVGRTYEYIYNSWLPETDYGLPHLFNFEYYPPEHKGPYDEESVSEIYIPVRV